MAQVKISELPSASSLTGSEVLPIVQGGSTLGATVNQIKDKIQASTINVLKMNASSVQTLANIGDLAFNPDTQTLEVKCSANVTLSIGQENYIRGKNAESSTILNGTVVYVSGGQGANSLIKRAGNADGTAERVIGVATQDIGANNIGFITTSGVVNKLNTSAYADGDLLWLGTNGALTNVKPDTSVDQICIGVVLRAHATEGSILVAVKDDWRDKLAEVRSDLSETIDKLTELVFDETDIPSEYTIIDNLSVRATDGTENPNIGYSVTKYIPIIGNTIIYGNQQIVATTTTIGLAFYEGEDLSTFISGHTWGVSASVAHLEDASVSVPVNAKYVRISLYTDQKSSFYIRQRVEVSKFDALQQKVDAVDDKCDGLANDITAINERFDSSGGFEVNVPLTIIDGISVRATNGTENENPSYCSSDFFEVRGNYIRFSNQQIVATTTTIGLAFYEGEDLSTFISGHKWGVSAAQASLSEDTTAIPIGAKYARISAALENKGKLWLVMGQSGEHHYGLEERVDILEGDAHRESIHNDVEHIYEFPCSPATMQVVGNGTIASHKIGVWDEIYRQTLGCVKCHLVGDSENINNSIREITTTSVELEHKVILGSFALEKDYDVTNLTGVKFSLIDRANRRATISILGNYEGTSDKVRFLRGGWFHFATTTDSIALDNPTFDINNVVGWEILVICKAAIDVYVNNIAVANAMHKGGVCIVVDNMNPNVPAMCDYAYSKGIKLSCSIVPGWIGSINPSLAHATEEEIAQCAEEGHFIFNHTWTHNTGDDMTFDEQADDVFKAESWMIDKGYKEGSKAVSCPSAAFNNLKYGAYFATNMNLLYHHWISAVNHPIHIPYYPMTKLLNITYLDGIWSGYTSMDAVDAWLGYVQRAIDCGGIAVIGMHGTFWDKDTSYPNGEAFKHFIDQLALIEDLRVYTIGDILDKRYF